LISGRDARSALRSRLGGQAFEAVWSSGRSMGAKRAVEYARQLREFKQSLQHRW
jgi:hypothetical protein